MLPLKICFACAKKKREILLGKLEKIKNKKT